MHADELRSTLQKPRVAELIKPYKAGRLVNQVRKLAEVVTRLPHVERSPDPTGDFLLALSEGGKADYLVTGDRAVSWPSAITKNADRLSARIRGVVRLN